MTALLSLALLLFVVVYTVTLLAYLLPVLAAWTRGHPTRPRPLGTSGPRPLIAVVAPCRRAAASIPGFVRAVRSQRYPPEKIRLWLAVDRDDPNDASVEVARAAGAEVVERFDPPVKTKGAALNGLFQAALKQEPFDAVVVFDIDARPAPNFLERLAAYFQDGAAVVQTATAGRAHAGAGFDGLSELGQAFSRLHQRGRAILGWPGLLAGGGMAFGRAALARLDWQTSTGHHLSDDGELNVRCLLRGIPVRYAADLVLSNDVPADAREVRLQRRRWSAGYLEIGWAYRRPLLRRLLRGDLRALDLVASLFLASAFSLLFVAAGALAGALALAAAFGSPTAPVAALLAVLWSIHAGLYWGVIRSTGAPMGWREWRRLPSFLALRGLAYLEAFCLAFRPRGRNPVPATHASEPGGNHP